MDHLLEIESIRGEEEQWKYVSHHCEIPEIPGCAPSGSSKPQPLTHGDFEAAVPPVTLACDYTRLWHHLMILSLPPGAVGQGSVPTLPGIHPLSKER